MSGSVRTGRYSGDLWFLEMMLSHPGLRLLVSGIFTRLYQLILPPLAKMTLLLLKHFFSSVHFKNDRLASSTVFVTRLNECLKFGSITL